VDLGISGRIFNEFREMGDEGIVWIKLAQNRIQWLEFINTAMIFPVP